MKGHFSNEPPAFPRLRSPRSEEEIKKIVRENEEEIKARKIQLIDIDLDEDSYPKAIYTIEEKINEIIDYINKHEDL